MVAMMAKPAPLPQSLAGAGVLVLGVAWSLGSALAHWGQIRAAGVPLPSALLLVIGGGMLTMAGVWLGVAAVAWAMGRLLGGLARFRKILFAISAAAPPLWPAAPAWALVLAGVGPGALRAVLVTIAAVGVLGFLASLVSALRTVEGFSRLRACACAALTVVFCISYLSLQ